MGSSGSIAGRVVDRRGRPVAGAAVLIEASSAPHPDIAALSGGDGGFGFDDLAPGSYTLLARSEAGATGRAQVELGDGARATLTIALE